MKDRFIILLCFFIFVSVVAIYLLSITIESKEKINPITKGLIKDLPSSIYIDSLNKNTSVCKCINQWVNLEYNIYRGVYEYVYYCNLVTLECSI